MRVAESRSSSVSGDLQELQSTYLMGGGRARREVNECTSATARLLLSSMFAQLQPQQPHGQRRPYWTLAQLQRAHSLT